MTPAKEKLESPMQDCLDKKCPNEASACKKDVTGCLTPALKCDSKCGNDVACLRTCAAASGNQHLKDLYIYIIIFQCCLW